MIPKIIHWCWFGPNELTELSKECIDSWEKYCPEYKVVKWTEESIKEIDSPFLKNALKKKQWAYASDYVRLYALYHFGGIYLDTDMEVIKNLDGFLSDDIFFGKEDDSHISAGIIGAVEKNKIIQNLIAYYDQPSLVNTFVNIPWIITNEIKPTDNVTLYHKKVFYPYNPNDSKAHKQLMFKSIVHETAAIHHWEKKWKLSFFNRINRKIHQLRFQK